ncbi:MAG: (Fe-S)-binding protein, partial [Thermoplasmata archaeon]|nr:(Fe-S)-binding protein [Thermoplasmata archaeon]
MNSIKVDVTKEAQDQVRELIKSQEPGTAVRVYLELGGG